MKAWLGLGSNQQQPVMQLQHALRRLTEAEGITLLRTSSFYSTPPWGDEQQDHFVNAVAQLETRLASHQLLHVLQSIEDAMGRQRSDRRWGPRVIDIDLLLFGEQELSTADLVLPHPRMHERAFVLMPLAELDSTLEIPGHGSVSVLLSQLDRSGIHQLNEPGTD
jgi:2-amino-4-hydroxy-6-hydroxymethyldihydropteridine diphosphokinase